MIVNGAKVAITSTVANWYLNCMCFHECFHEWLKDRDTQMS